MLFTNSVNTKDADWWWSGANVSAPTMTATPTTCHHTLTLLSRPTMRTPKVFNRPCRTRIPAKSRIVRPGVTSKSNCRFRYAPRNEAAPKSMPAVTATWPRTLNQPVNHAQAAAVRGGARRWAQKYRPAEVGYAEQISAIASPTNRVIRPTATQPQVITAGPPVFMPNR